MMSSVDIDAVSPLFKINRILMGGKNFEITSFTSNGDQVSGMIKFNNSADKALIKVKFKEAGLNGLQLTEDGNILKFNYQSEKS